MIYRYNQWLDESEKVDAAAPDMSAEPEADLTPAQMEAPLEPASVEDMDETTDIGKFTKIDQARKDAVKAFKDKQKEFLAMPEETRKNPVSEEDKTKVQTMKDELIGLHKTMKDAELEFNKFNEELLGVSEEEEDIEP